MSPHWSRLHEGDGLVVGDWRCDVRTPGRSAEEPVLAHEIVFVRRGLFLRHGPGAPIVCDSTRVLFAHAGESFRFSHPLPGGDACTYLLLSAERLAQALETDAGRGPRIGSRPRFPPAATPLAPEVDLLHRRLLCWLARGPGDALAVEELVPQLAAAALRIPGASPGAVGAAARRSHRRAADRVRELVAARYRERLTLAQIAAEVGLSPFHLGRIFRRETGMPIHRHLLRVRLRAALEGVADGASDLTALALDCGFASHSHLTETCTRELGVPPSVFRSRPGVADLRELAARLVQR